MATGRFDGTCDGDGHLRGGWSKPDAKEGGAPSPFDLAPVLPQPVLLVLTRTQSRAFAPRPRPKGSPEVVGFFEKNERCTEALAWPEVFGAATPEAEQKLNKALVRDRWILASHEEEAQLKACVTGDRIAASQSFEVTFNDKSVVSVSFSVIGRAEAGTHPWDPGAASEETYDAMTGARVTKANLLAPTPRAKHALDALLGRCLAQGFPPEVAGDMKEKFTADNPHLLVRIVPRGLLFAGQGYPPPLRNLEGQGPTITWSAPSRPAPSRAMRAWHASGRTRSRQRRVTTRAARERFKPALGPSPRQVASPRPAGQRPSASSSARGRPRGRAGRTNLRPVRAVREPTPYAGPGTTGRTRDPCRRTRQDDFRYTPGIATAQNPGRAARRGGSRRGGQTIPLSAISRSRSGASAARMRQATGPWRLGRTERPPRSPRYALDPRPARRAVRRQS